MKNPLILKLVSLITSTFPKLGIGSETILQGAIAHTSLGWQWPALRCSDKINNIALYDYLEPSMQVKSVPALLEWADITLHNLRHFPGRAVGLDGYFGLSDVVQGSTGLRKLAFSLPEGFPDRCFEYTAAMFNLELAEVVKNSVPIRAIVADDDNEYVVTRDGLEVGIKDGFPLIGADDWNTSAYGLVPELLEMPRGDYYVGCDYDVLSKVRSVVWDNQTKISDFAGIDWAMQALRILAEGVNLRFLLDGVTRMRVEDTYDKERLKAFKDAATLFKALAYSDRDKVRSLEVILVPQFMTLAKFRREVYSTNKRVPAFFRQSVRERIQDVLDQYVANEEVENAK